MILILSEDFDTPTRRIVSKLKQRRANFTVLYGSDKPGFKKYWNITKDQIEVCKDCEFRYICTDCRAYTERTHINEEGLDISKPLKCGYNPYTAEWAEWSSNPLKQKAIDFYGMRD